MGGASLNRAVHRLGGRYAPWVGVAPALLLLACTFGVGLGLGMVQSLGWFPAAGLRELSLRAYTDLLAEPRLWRAAWESLRIGLLSTALSSVAALGIALALRPLAGRPALRTLLRAPLLVPHLGVAAVMLLVLAQSGLLSRVSAELGLLNDPGQFPALVQDRWAVGLIATYVYKETPFIVLFLFALLERIGTDHEAAARTLGANAWQRFWRVLLPMLVPGLAASSLIVFAFVFGAFEFPLLLARTHPETLPVLAWHAYQDVNLAARPRAMAVSMLIAVATLLLALGYYRLLRRVRSF